MVSARMVFITSALMFVSTIFFDQNSATADIFNFEGDITSSQEVPSDTGSSASGFLTATYDDATGQLDWNINFTGVTATAIHFHNEDIGVNGPVVVNIGNISGLGSPNIGSTTLTTELGDDLVSGRFYVNIHSSAFPAGEIRGQVLLAVPEPSGLLVCCVAGLVLVTNRRKRKGSC